MPMGKTDYSKDLRVASATGDLGKQFLQRLYSSYPRVHVCVCVCVCVFTCMYILYAAAKSLQSCPTLCNPIDSSPPGSSVLGLLQAILEWIAISFSIYIVYLPRSIQTHTYMCIHMGVPSSKKYIKTSLV